MFVYELALELGKTSGEVVALASALGIDGLSPTSALSPAQVAELRRAIGPEASSIPAAPPLAPTASASVGATGGGSQAAGRGTRVLLAGVIVVVLGFFAFVALGSGGSSSADEGASTGAAGGEVGSTDPTAPDEVDDTESARPDARTEPDDETSTPVASEESDGPIALDAPRYCPAANAFTEIVDQLQMAGSYEVSKEIVDARGGELLDALDDMRAGLGASGPMLDPVIEWYDALVEAVATSSTEAEYQAAMASSASDPEAASDAWAQVPTGCTFESVGERIEG